MFAIANIIAAAFVRNYLEIKYILLVHNKYIYNIGTTKNIIPKYSTIKTIIVSSSKM